MMRRRGQDRGLRRIEHFKTCRIQQHGTAAPPSFFRIFVMLISIAASGWRGRSITRATTAVTAFSSTSSTSTSTFITTSPSSFYCSSSARRRRWAPTPVSLQQQPNYHRYHRSLAVAAAAASGGGGGGGGRVSSAVQDKELLDKTTTGKKGQQQKKKKQKQAPFDKNPPKGTRDFYPAEMSVRKWLFDQWRQTAHTFGFVEYDAPVVENEALYTRKAGEEVVDQLYNFQDKGDRRLALRAEMTPSLARMVLAKSGAIPMPMKWYSIPQCWRYERMTRGRRREHYQWNMDIWGVAGETAEVELIASMITFFQRVGLTSADVGIKVNSRLVIGEVLTALGVPEEKFAPTCVLIDKLEKVPLDAIQSELDALGLDRSVVEQLVEVLTKKSIEEIQEALVERSSESTPSPAIEQLTRFMKLCKDYQIDDWIVFDASIVRGLAYYTGIVFEAFDRQGELRAIAGGGRYDTLLETYTGQSASNIPAVGFGFGDAVILELLKERNKLPDFDNQDGIDVIVYAMDEELYPVAIRIANMLRAAATTSPATATTAPLSVDVVLETKKLKWVFKHADRSNAKYCCIIGAEEYADGQQVSIKDMKLGEQETVPIDQLSTWVASRSQQ